MTVIEHFQERDVGGIKGILDDAGIKHHFNRVSDEALVDQDRSYTLVMRKQDHEQVVSLLVNLYQIEEPKPFTGTCPGCKEQVDQVFVCPACGRLLMENRINTMEAHPFVLYLQRNNLLGPYNRRILAHIQDVAETEEKEALAELKRRVIILIGWFIGIVLLLVALSQIKNLF
ncbi:MAG: hypothetical protein ABIF71_04615 [Planctomycetota bacterium]